ncbi:HNH endonuclease signature motif containing protein, partial [Humibacter ginsengiterrae]
TCGDDGDATGVAPVKTGVQPFVLIDADGRFAELLGYGPIPPSAAAKALRDAPSFRKVLADPIRPAQLNLDTKRYRPTPDQRTWLTLRYGLDEDAAPYLPVGVTTGAEIDHVIERQHGGPTNVTNLAPLKPRLHRLKTVTGIRLDPKPDGGIRVRTPTGYDSDPPPF